MVISLCTVLALAAISALSANSVGAAGSKPSLQQWWTRDGGSVLTVIPAEAELASSASSAHTPGDMKSSCSTARSNIQELRSAGRIPSKSLEKQLELADSFLRTGLDLCIRTGLTTHKESQAFVTDAKHAGAHLRLLLEGFRSEGVSTTTTTTTTTTSVASVDAAINTLYYNVSQAFQTSTTAGWQAIYSNDYPGVVNMTTFFNCAASESQVTLQMVPNLMTLEPAPTWVLSNAGFPYFVPTGQPPAGTTYILQVSSSGTGGPSTQLEHVTILNGVAYFYQGPNC
jgi:hypothetical protein